MHDLVLDETKDGTFAYISRWEERNIVVFSLARNESWIVKTPGIEVFSIALSPEDHEPRQLYFGHYYSFELFSISVAALRSGTGTANPKIIGKWTAKPYRLMIDNHGTMYAAFLWENYILSWNTSEPFQEKRFHKVTGIFANRQFAFSLDQNGTFWMTETDAKKEPRYMLRLLKTAVGEKSSEALPVAQATSQLQKRSIQTEKLPFKVILICSVVFNLILLGLIILRKKRITCESDEMTVLYENHGYVNLRPRFP
ncbi:uncharacterized protein LOC135938077 [Cloeon dipterum]|uniref:uncharacterized protein LOC135938077 n=1 Tax=Cloeon dipterum TaxID=197152 RepID=UPI00321F9169